MTPVRILAVVLLIAVSVWGARVLEPRLLNPSAERTASDERLALVERAPSATPQDPGSTERVAMVWARLLDAARLTAGTAPALVFDADAIAHSHASGEVFFGPSVLVLPDDEIAFVLGHELSHLMLEHHGRMRELARAVNDAKGSPDIAHAEHWLVEFEADARALALMRDARFDVAGVARYLSRRSMADGVTHPGTVRRARALGA
ncbi:MAG: M48 family metalloprotease [Burkholderiales bacterium]